MNKDDTITLPTGVDFREPGHDYAHKLFEGEALIRLWALLDTPRPRKITELEDLRPGDLLK